MYPYDTVIFDLDGTLLNTLQDLADSTNYALALQGMPARTLEEVRRFVGNGVGRLIHRAVPEGTPEEVEARVLADFRAHYTLNMEHKTAPYPGVLPLLDRLGQAGIRTAVVSNKFDSAVKGLCHAYFGARIPVAIGESQGVAREPAPDTVFRALEELGAGTGRLRGRLRCGHPDRRQRRAALPFGELGLPGRGVSHRPWRPAHRGHPPGIGGPAPRRIRPKSTRHSKAMAGAFFNTSGSSRSQGQRGGSARGGRQS